MPRTEHAAAHPDRREIAGVLEAVLDEARDYLAGLDDRPVRASDADRAAHRFDGPLPEAGAGALPTLRRLIRDAPDAAVHSGGPRCFHFVMGGSTPAALGADLLATVYDQIAYAWVTSPLALRLEVQSLQWLRALFGLPPDGGGVMTTGATMANFVGLAAARQWWGERQGFDPAEEGLAGRPQITVHSSGHVHASTVKVLGMLGVGRRAVRVHARDERGTLDLDALERALTYGDDGPAIVVANAGEVNAGAFDPIQEVAELTRAHGAWLHVDGAFGLFAATSPRTAHLVAGVERADSVTVDGHKWLNVPYDCGFAFVQDAALLTRAFTYSGAYLPAPDDPHPNMGTIGPESSRRARSLAVWATLQAYGRVGVRDMVERHLDLAQHLAARVDEAPDLERLAEVPLNVVCFRYDPGDRSDEELDELNARLGAALVEDGRVYAGTTTFAGRTALRPAIVNWRTREKDIDLFVDVVREIGARIAEQ